MTITGGKLTTWRRMAKMAVDRIVEREGREAPCRTHEIPLGQPVDPATLPNVASVDEESRAHLAARYGHAAALRAAPRRGGPELGRRISPGCPTSSPRRLRGRANEQALSLGDVLLRRTRLGLLDARALTAPGAEARGRSPWRWRPNWAGTTRASARAGRLARARASRGARRAGAGRHRSGRVILRLRERTLDLGEPVLMGILNATPDSFSDEQRPKDLRRARGTRSRARRGRRGDRRRRRRVRAHRHGCRARGRGGRARRSARRAAGGERACSSRSTPGERRWRGARSPPARR